MPRPHSGELGLIQVRSDVEIVRTVKAEDWTTQRRVVTVKLKPLDDHSVEWRHHFRIAQIRLVLGTLRAHRFELLGVRFHYMTRLDDVDRTEFGECKLASGLTHSV